ncbi:unnamed protein product [Paramecium primaurelia]|uniref:CDP-diacylglycerol--glycerol-3-phosphate 3-phosphatidyltransferase n=1 Tax=Paramecium primaurelia TaxID=5886 RepID=A0A8S1LMW8_PARPR|nr:unnamed protein product [Paramecium primaurelia]
MNQLLNNLKFHKPFFKLNTAQIEILKDPVDFYVNLHKGIKNAQKRIVWSTLYIGNGNMEEFLIESLSNQQRRFEQLRISLLMDYYRGTRRDKKNHQTPIDHYLYLRMQNLYSNNMKLGLMRHPFLPQFANMLEESAAREIFNVHHMKWYIFDNRVILTGANLQEQYFINRQDRYMVFHEANELADYLDDAQSALLQHAYYVDFDSNSKFDPLRAQPFKRQQYFKEFHQTWKIFKFSYKEAAEIKSDDEEYQEQQQEKVQKQEEDNDNNIKQEQEQEEELSKEEMLQFYERDLIVEQKIQERKEQAKLILNKSFNKGDVQNIINRLEKALYKDEERELDEGEECTVLITLHIPYLQTDEDKLVFMKILENLDQFTSVTLASGYMNFTKTIINFVNNCKTDIKFITASPGANGFHKAGKAKSFIPILYRYFELDIDKPIFEYKRNGWTFHTKGFWAELQDGSTMTIIGSSNYAVRSEKRDNEIQAYIFTQCPMFKQDLKKEQNYLLNYAEKITKEEIIKDNEIKINWKIKLLSKIFKSMM